MKKKALSAGREYSYSYSLLNSNIGNFTLIREGAATAGTYTYQLEHSHVYLVTVVRASSFDSATHGMYIVASWNGAGSVSVIKESSGVTLSQDKTTLTVTTTLSQMTISIMRIA